MSRPPPSSAVDAGIDHDSPWGRHAPAAWRGASLAVAHAVPANWRLAERLVKVFRRPIKYGGQPCYDVTVWGLRLRLTPHGNVSEARLLYAPQLFDAEERAFLVGHLPPGSVFVDIGANVGAYTYWAHRCQQGRGRIVAFEPDTEMRARLQFNIAGNALAGIDVVAAALSDRQGTALLHVNRSQRGQNTLEPAQARASGAETSALSVDLDTLWACAQRLGVERIDALKIDIEGHEVPVLRHFYAHAPESAWPRAVLAEHAHDADDAVGRILRAAGYACVLQTARNRGYERRAAATGPAPC